MTEYTKTVDYVAGLGQEKRITDARYADVDSTGEFVVVLHGREGKERKTRIPTDRVVKIND